MPMSKGKNTNARRPGMGWESQIPSGPKGPPSSPRKISGEKIFFRLLFSAESSRPK